MSRTTVRRWLARFVAQRCDGLQDYARSGRPAGIKPTTRALVVALACSRPGDRDVPLSRYSLSELTVAVASQLEADTSAPARSAIWRVLLRDALRPWRYRSWIFPRDAHFLELAGPVLDLYLERSRTSPGRGGIVNATRPQAQLTVPVVVDRDHIQGGADAPITLVEYGDYECPFLRSCVPRHQGPLMTGYIQAQMGDGLRFVFRNCPITNSQPLDRAQER